MREAQSVKIITALKRKKALIRAYDPCAKDNARKLIPDIIYCRNAYEAARGADALLIITEWNEFKQLNLGKIKKLMKTPIIIDGRNIYDRKKLEQIGFKYIGMGR